MTDLEQRAHDLAMSYTLYDSIHNMPDERLEIDEFFANYKRALEECKTLLKES